MYFCENMYPIGDVCAPQGRPLNAHCELVLLRAARLGHSLPQALSTPLSLTLIAPPARRLFAAIYIFAGA
jgi:hypothetical protein